MYFFVFFSLFGPFPPSVVSCLLSNSSCFRSQSGGGCGWGQQEVHGAQWGTIRCSDRLSLAASRVLHGTGLCDIDPTRAHLLLKLNTFPSLDSTSPVSLIFNCLLKFWQYWWFFFFKSVWKDITHGDGSPSSGTTHEMYWYYIPFQVTTNKVLNNLWIFKMHRIQSYHDLRSFTSSIALQVKMDTKHIQSWSKVPVSFTAHVSVMNQWNTNYFVTKTVIKFCSEMTLL